MLVDNVTISVKAGDGGDGSASLLHNGLTFKGGPDGGNGGNGGNVYIQGSANLNDLSEFQYKKSISALDGVPGGRRKLYGKNADHKTIFVPLGTKVTDTNSGTFFEITDQTTAHLLASGGKGGRGNVEFKSATNQTPRYAEKGTNGESKVFHLELKLIAQIGLIGLPNAGKSSLLAVLTNANPKIGAYPFTTLFPNIGMLGKYAIADIPGLIEGAAKGKGLGAQFLKHIEKTKIIVHCIEPSDSDMVKNYHTVRHEFEQYNPLLLDKPELILLTKQDLVDLKTLKKNITTFKKMKKTVLSVSIYDEKSIQELEKVLDGML